MIASVSVHFNPNLPWYIARSAGIVSWALITATPSIMLRKMAAERLRSSVRTRMVPSSWAAV